MTLERTVVEYPTSEWAWASWGDFWSGDDFGWSGAADREKARAIYQRGLSAGVEDPDILLERLQSLAQGPEPGTQETPE
jgi:hypothetical protein